MAPLKLMLFMLSHGLAIASLAALFYATGEWIERRVGPIAIAELGPGVVRMTLGTIGWIALLFALAATQLLRAVVVLPLAVFALGAGVWRFYRDGHWQSAATVPLNLGRARLAQTERREAGQPRGSLPPARDARDARDARAREALPRLAAEHTLWLLPGLVLAGLFVRCLTFNVGWDDAVYHLTLPKLYLAHGGFRPIEFNVYSHWPHGVELLYALAMLAQDYVLAKLVHWLILCVLVVAVFQICRARTSAPIALVASLLVLGNEVVLFEGERAYVDLAFALYLLVAVASADAYLRARQPPLLWLCAACCGALAATKLSGVVAVGCVLLIVAYRLRSEPRALLRAGGVIAAALLLLGGPWYVKSYLYTGNPIYPFAFERFGGPHWSASLGEQLFEWQHRIGMGRRLLDYVLLPVRVPWLGGQGYAHFDGKISELWLLLVPLAFALRPRDGSADFYLICAGLFFGSWALSSQQMRLLIPALPLLAVATALALEELLRRLAATRFDTSRARAILLIAFGALLSPVWLPRLARASSDVAQLVDHGPGDPSAALPDGLAFVNQHTPPQAKLMLLDFNRGFWCERSYVADSFFEASQLAAFIGLADTVPQLRALLTQLGITHVYRGAADWGVSYSQLLDRLLDDPELAETVYQCRDRHCSLYALRPD